MCEQSRKTAQGASERSQPAVERVRSCPGDDRDYLMRETASGSASNAGVLYTISSMQATKGGNLRVDFSSMSVIPSYNG